MTNKTILITGSTDGIGKQTAIELAKFGSRIIIHGRNGERCKKAAVEIADKTENLNIDYLSADFTSLAQVKEMANSMNSKYERLDVLINNAGVFENEKIFTINGYEKTFSINHLAHFLLTNLLIDLLKITAPSRIINVSSIAHSNCDFDLENLNGEKYFNNYNAYAISKAANILFTYKLAEDLKETDVTVNSLHPGVITTKLLRKGFNMQGASLEEGASTSVYLTSSPEVGGVTGKYFINSEESNSAPFTYDAELQGKLRDVSYKMVEKFL
jgi:NAD(P)-dependent dehydrogenase (short-subunit alcohol dehydrogenase family)